MPSCKCGERRESEFYHYYPSKCKPCMREYSRQYWHDNKERYYELRRYRKSVDKETGDDLRKLARLTVDWESKRAEIERERKAMLK